MSGGIVLNELGFNILDLLELQFLENIMGRKVNETKALMPGGLDFDNGKT